MKLNLPPKVRAVIYILTALGAPIIPYLLAKNVIGTLEVALWGAEVMAVNALAALNVDHNS